MTDKSEHEKCTWEMFEAGVDRIIVHLESQKKRYRAVYGPPKGGLPLAVVLANRMEMELILDEGKVTLDTLIVDDISDTGKTLEKFKQKGNHIVTLYSTAWTKVKPNFYVYEKKDRYIDYPWE